MKNSVPVFLLLVALLSAEPKNSDTSAIIPTPQPATQTDISKIDSLKLNSGNSIGGIEKKAVNDAKSDRNKNDDGTRLETMLPDTSKLDTAQKKLPPPDVKTKSPAAIVEESEEDLILDGGEESIIAPLPVETIPQKALSPVDSQNRGSESAIFDSSIQSKDSATGEQQNEKAFHYPAAALPKISEESVQPMRIEKMQSINFAKNYKEYRSPKIAILLSLLLPGAGQAYAHNGIKTGIFGAIEVGFIAAGAIVAFQGNKKWKKAHSFADDHYSIDSFYTYYKTLTDNRSQDTEQIFEANLSYEDFKKNAEKKNQDYYKDIKDEVSPYVQGWDDVKPRFDAMFEIINGSDENGEYITDDDSTWLVRFVDNNGDTSLAQYGFSDNQMKYKDTLSRADSYFRWSKGLFTMVLLNHFASAIDAAITAKAYNDKLLGKHSLWQKFNIRETYVSTPIGPANGFALEVRF